MIDRRHPVRFYLALAWALAGGTWTMGGGPQIDFNRDIRPILAENCYQCHGPDQGKRKAHLRLDTREGIFSSRQGAPPVIPGKPQESELYRRITTGDANERMPDPKSGKNLTDRQLDLIKKWIEQGAEWK